MNFQRRSMTCSRSHTSRICARIPIPDYQLAQRNGCKHQVRWQGVESDSIRVFCKVGFTSGRDSQSRITWWVNSVDTVWWELRKELRMSSPEKRKLSESWGRAVERHTTESWPRGRRSSQFQLKTRKDFLTIKGAHRWKGWWLNSLGAAGGEFCTTGGFQISLN